MYSLSVCLFLCLCLCLCLCSHVMWLSRKLLYAALPTPTRPFTSLCKITLDFCVVRLMERPPPPPPLFFLSFFWRRGGGGSKANNSCCSHGFLRFLTVTRARVCVCVCARIFSYIYILFNTAVRISMHNPVWGSGRKVGSCWSQLCVCCHVQRHSDCGPKPDGWVRRQATEWWRCLRPRVWPGR